jgi:isoleucyl-tRNA synthetase
MFKREFEGFSKTEERILALWKEHNTFLTSIEKRRSAKHFSFYDGPPFATGLPHYGHILAGTIKDVVARYKTMQGFCVERRFGWDCHGLPIETEIEKEHNLTGAIAIEQYGIAAFNEACRKIVLRYTKEWEKTVIRMGRWVSFDETYRTMDKSFMESVWWVFGELWQKGLVYEGFKVMHYSPKLGTPISNFEANLNYRETDDPSLTIKCKIVGEEGYLLVWTTTPWTLPSNLALAVHPELSYLKVREEETGNIYYVAKECLSSVFDKKKYEVMGEVKGKELVGKKYEPLFPFFKDHPNSFRVLAGSFVATGEGTGIVHMAPAFGEDDFALCKEANIDIVCPVDANCKFTEEVPLYAGTFVKDADKEIMRHLKAEGKVFKQATLRHRYPFCWRTDMPLIYRAVSTWFVAVEKIKDKIIANNKKIHWVPGHIKEGRFGKWLENAKDWAISRNRYWGTPLPIWRAEDGTIIVITSVEELEKRTHSKVEDLHRHYIDDLTFTENGKLFTRVSEVFDCWFESGSMPYAQNHYPFAKKEETMRDFPADFIAEGIDQTRGWFYTLTVLASALFDKPPFKNVIVNGIVLAEDGHKMSKRLKNYPEPEIVFQKYGADAVRLTLLNSPVVRAEEMNFSSDAVENVLKQILLPLWNSYSFLATYAKIYNWSPVKVEKVKAPIDRWILSLLEKLVLNVTESMDSYTLDKAIQPIIAFIEELTNWYIRRSRRRFWTEENIADQKEAFATLYHVLLTLSKVTAPFVPFISEAIYQELRTEEMPTSVHLCDFPKPHKEGRDIALENEMELTQILVNLGHSLRKEHQLKVRQPLSEAYIATSDPVILEAIRIQEELIKDELNVKKISFSLDETQFVQFKPKANFRALGKKVGNKMNEVRAKIEALDQKQLALLALQKSLEIPVDDSFVSLEEEDVLIQRQVHEGIIAATSGPFTIALDTEITRELELEGIAREIVNKVNTKRKADSFDVQDRIHLTIETTPLIKEAVDAFKEVIKEEILAASVTFGEVAVGEDYEINGEKTRFQLEKL